MLLLALADKAGAGEFYAELGAGVMVSDSGWNGDEPTAIGGLGWQSGHQDLSPAFSGRWRLGWEHVSNWGSRAGDHADIAGIRFQVILKP